MDTSKPVLGISLDGVEYLRTSEAIKFLRIGRNLFIKLKSTDPTFPKPLVLGPYTLRWSVPELKAWAQSRREAAR